MPVFAYRATDAARGDVRGTIAADTPRQARDLLRGRGLIVREVGEAGGETGRGLVGALLAGLTGRWGTGRRGATAEAGERGAGGGGRAIEAADASAGARAPAGAESPPVLGRLGRRSRSLRRSATAFFRELSTLLSVGVPLLEALETLAKQHAGRFRTIVLLLRDRVAGGTSLGQALREHPAAFDELAVNITEVGEDAGTLDESLARLADFRERAEQLKNRVTTALIYPGIVLVLAVASSVFLMTFVVPRIIEPLVEQGIELPLPTRIVKGASDFLIGWGWLAALVLAGVAVLIGAALRSERGRRAAHRAVLRLPLLGELIRKQAIVRMCVVLGTLLRSGIVFVRALQIARRSTGNLVLRDALAACEKAVTAGTDIGPAVERTGAFPPMVVQIFSVGQQSGRLEEMLERLGQTYDQQVNTTAQRFAAVLEPALIVLLALVVLTVVLATVLPILEAGNAIQ